MSRSWCVLPASPQIIEAMVAATKARGAVTIVAGGSAAVWARAFGAGAGGVSVISNGGPGVASMLAGTTTPGIAVLSAHPK